MRRSIARAVWARSRDAGGMVARPPPSLLAALTTTTMPKVMNVEVVAGTRGFAAQTKKDKSRKDADAAARVEIVFVDDPSEVTVEDTGLTPQKTVELLDKFIVGQTDAKKASRGGTSESLAPTQD